MSIVDIRIQKPYRECCQLYGMRQSGKSNLLKYLLERTPCRWVLIDTLRQHNWNPLKSDRQEIIKPVDTDFSSFLDQIIDDRWKQGNCIIAVEELDAYQTIWNLSPSLKKLINWGGNRNLSLWYTVRRLANVHKDVVANTEHHFIFKAYVPNDIEYYRKFVGDVADYARDLAPYHFIYYKVGSQPQFCRPVKLVL